VTYSDHTDFLVSNLFYPSDLLSPVVVVGEQYG